MPKRTEKKSEERMQFIDTDAAAEYCGISRSFLEKRRLAGNGPPFTKIGRRVVYSRALLDEWLSKQVRNSTSEYELAGGAI